VKPLLWIPVLLLAGCATWYPEFEQPRAVDRVLADAVVATRAPPVEQKAALARAQQAYAQSPEALNRLRLAVLLATLPSPFRDEARAVELLEPIADTASPGIGPFAAFLSTQIAERQRLVREFERASREAERLAKERERTDRERSLSEKEREKERDKREEALRQQLEALRSIERGILEREDKLHRKPR
jgi:hypothetical protein